MFFKGKKNNDTDFDYSDNLFGTYKEDVITESYDFRPYQSLETNSNKNVGFLPGFTYNQSIKDNVSTMDKVSVTKNQQLQILNVLSAIKME